MFFNSLMPVATKSGAPPNPGRRGRVFAALVGMTVAVFVGSLRNIPAQAAECSRFEGVGLSGTLTLSEDWTKATMETPDGTSTSFDLTSCATGSLSYCGTTPDDPEATLTLAFITGRLTTTDDAPSDFVLVDGLWAFEAACVQ